MLAEFPCEHLQINFSNDRKVHRKIRTTAEREKESMGECENGCVGMQNAEIKVKSFNAKEQGNEIRRIVG